MPSDYLDPADNAFRLTRRHMLLLAGGTAATGLLFASGVAHADPRYLRAERMSRAVAAVLTAAAPAAQTSPLAPFQQAAQTSFAPINSGLTFGQPTDMAAGWDGTLWAIDQQGAPRVYDPLSDTWQLHGSGVDAAALINDEGPAVYFKGGEAYVADGNSVAQPIASLWPQLPASYKLGVTGAAWSQPLGKLVLFRGGTYLTVPWPAPGASAATAVYHAAMQPGPTRTAVPGTPTAGPYPATSASATPTTSHTPAASATPAASHSATPAPSHTPAATATPAAIQSPTPAPSHTPAASATLAASHSPTPAGTPVRVELKAATAAADYVPAPLTSLQAWSTNADPAWQDGVIDGVASLGSGLALLIRGGELRMMSLSYGTGGADIVGDTHPLSQADVHVSFNSLPADWLANGVDAGFWVDNASTFYVFRGPQVATQKQGSGGWSYHYIRGAAAPWPPTWHPGLQHAPNGRTSGLWAASVEGYPMSFDGTRWTQQPGDASSIGVGQDGSVFSVGAHNQQQLSQWSGSGWNPVASHSSPLAQVSVGNSAHVWTRDSNNAVHQLNVAHGQLQPVSQVGTATHLAANYDGSLYSCNGSDSNTYRYASDLGVAPTAVSAPGTVQKVASTRFGVAHCLTTQNGATQAYQVQSPYVFRSANNYTTAFSDSIDEGLGNLYISSLITGGDLDPTVYFVVALDGHTGQELSRSAVAPSGLRYTAPVFDAVHETVIVGLTPEIDGGTPQPGVLLGLDARDLSQVRWRISLPNNLPLGPGRPTLVGSRLCVTDNSNTVLMYDTGLAPNATPSSTPLWTYSNPVSSGDAHRLPPPVLANGRVYAAWWLFSQAYGFTQLWLWNLDPDTGVGTQTVVDAAPGYRYVGDPRTVGYEWSWMGHAAPLLATVPGSQAGQKTRQVLFVNGGGSVAGVDISSNTVQYYDLPGANSYVTSGFGFANGVLWVGDIGSNLHGINGQSMQAVPNTPSALGDGSPGTEILTTPVPYSYGPGLLAVLLGVFDEGASVPGLLAFDPTSGNVASIPTQGTTFVALSPTVNNGNIYAGGAADVANSGSRAQVYSIRVDAALQGLRDFVVDSQLMQDFDDPSQPTHNPNGVARYQTHLTLIDDQKAPLGNHAVKLWSDQANTNIIVNGKNFSIGPDDDQYAAVTTDSSGVLTIVSGYTQPGGADTPDMSAPPLRAWASFMDPYERMLLFRDREFHNRVASAHATDAGQSSADDPARPNLQTAQKYGPIQKGVGNTGGTLFSADQQSQGQPQQVATTIQKMTASVGSAPPSGSKTLKASFALHATDTPAKYVAYTDTPGAQYSPVNVAANRAAVVLQTGGLSYSSNNDASIPPAYASMTPAEATLAIDALEGVPWQSSQYATPRVKAAAGKGTLHLGGFFDDFWSWLKSAAATITHVIVAVADDIYAGIRYIVDGVAHVFQAIVTGIEQIASAIGAFFVELAMKIEEVIEALSVLFQFGHIIDTHNMLKAELLNRINGIPGNASYPGFSNLVKSSVLPPINDFFNTAEQDVTNALNAMASALGSNSPAAFPGGGSTVHSAFTATPTAGGASSSTATQGTWGVQKFNAGVGSGAAATAVLSRQLRLGAGDPIADFFTTFASSISGNGTLASQWAKIKSGGQALDNTSSASDFIKQGLAELLEILALLVDGVLAVGNAAVNGLLGIVDDVIQSLFDPNTGLLSAPLNIPVLSWLYELLFGEPLTILNAMMLVIAIPMTIIWRVIEGKWPSDSPFSATRAMQLGAAPSETIRELALWNMLVSIVLGIMYGVGDAAGAGSVPLIIGRVALLLSLTSAAITTPSISSASVGKLTWSAWGLTLAMALLNILGSHDLSDLTAEYEALGRLGPALLSGLSLAQLLVQGLQWDPAYGEAPTNALGDAALGISMVTALPGIINPAKMENEVAALVIAALDVVMGVAAGVAGVLSAYSST